MPYSNCKQCRSVRLDTPTQGHCKYCRKCRIERATNKLTKQINEFSTLMKELL